MLARLQIGMTVMLLSVAVLWALVAIGTGRAAGAPAGAVIIVLAYAAVLAVEFVCLARVRRRDATRKASLAQLVAAWWGEVLSGPATFCWRQPFRSRLWPDHLPTDAFGRRGALLVHGFVCNRGLWNHWLQRLHDADVPFVAVNLEPVFGSIDDCLASLEAGMQAIERATGLAPVIVAHSMGGLVTRRWWLEHAGDHRVHHVVTIATPHSGTWLARFAMSRNTRQMRLDSAWLRDLARREPADRALRFTCFYGNCDNIVFPPRCATLSGADNRHLAGTAHLHMVSRAEPFAEMLRRLSEP